MNPMDALMPAHARVARKSRALATALVKTLPPPMLWKNNPAMLDVFAKIAAERSRQRQLLHDGKITFDCSSVIPDPNRKLRVLLEEVGEVAQELDRLESCKDRRGERFVLEDLETELIQVAAVAVAWLESLDNGKAGAR